MNYKESQIVGTEYQRARLVEIHNQKDVLPHIAFIEEMITVLPNRTLSAPVGQISTQYKPDSLIELFNPETGDPILNGDGSQMVMSQQMVMLVIHSLYMQLVRERDKANEPVITPEPQVVQATFIAPEPLIEPLETPAETPVEEVPFEGYPSLPVDEPLPEEIVQPPVEEPPVPDGETPPATEPSVDPEII